MLPVGENAEQQHGPDTQMNHDVSGVEDIVPEGDVLHIDKVDDTAIDEAVGYVAGATAYHEAETDVFITLNVLA